MVKSFFKTRSLLILKLGFEDQSHKLYRVYINDDPGLTLTYFNNSMLISEHRYIELFLNSTPAGRSDGGMSGGMSGSGFGSGGNMNDNFDNMGNMGGNDMQGMMGMNKAQMNMMSQAGD